MNPPAALHSAMSRDRKPFTYTPGGLDLSEIKSERMAKRLIRNAMNQGVPEVPVNPIQSPPMPSTPVAIPNFNCLPVQVFPSFNLPANPKSLLRTRSQPDQKEVPVQRLPSASVNNKNNENVYNNNMSTYTQINNNRPTSMFEYSAPSDYSLPKNTNGTDRYTAPVLPEISYEADYFRVLPTVNPSTNSESEKIAKCEEHKTERVKPLNIINNRKDNEDVINNKVPNLETSNIIEPMKEKDDVINDKVPNSETENEKHLPLNDNIQKQLDLLKSTMTALDAIKIDLTSKSTKPDESTRTDDEQKEVKVTKKEIKKEKAVEEQNGDQNGDGSVEAELTVTLPTKKSAAKTETKVEVASKTLPDGSVEEVKTTTTKTTIDGRTEIRTKTETTIIPKEEDDEEIVEEVEEEEEEQVIGNGEETKTTEEIESKHEKSSKAVEPKDEEKEEDKIVKTEERSETTTTTTKKVVVVESPKEEESEEIAEEEVTEEIEEAEPVTITIKKEEKVEEEVLTPKLNETDKEVEDEEKEEIIETEQEKEDVTETKPETEVEEDVEEEEVEEEEENEETKEPQKQAPNNDDEDKEEEDEEEYQEAEETENDVKEEKEVEVVETKEEKIIEIQLESAKDEVTNDKEVVDTETKPSQESDIVNETTEKEEIKPSLNEEEPKAEPSLLNESKIPLREPSVPLEKVEDVEIKPIGFGPEVITKSHTENTEIITSTVAPAGGLSTQTEYNKVENIITVNRTTKILDHNYETLTQQGIPTIKSYVPPPSIDRVLSTPLPSRPYQSVYPSEPTSERRHSLLLDRLSVERQIPVETYNTYTNQTHDQQTQWQDDPRAEVLEVSNVKPSSITNQQWFQQTKNSTAIFNNTQSYTPTTQVWNQPKPQPQPQQYSPSVQPQYQQPSPQPQPQYQPVSQPQPQYQTSPQPQSQYQPQPQYQPAYSEPIREKTPSINFNSYTPKPTWASNVESASTLPQPTQYSYLNKDTTESYQKSTQQLSSSYVPPPWEQDSSYVPVNSTQNYYQPPPQTTYNPAPTQSWKPPPSNKYTKPAPISYVPPAPNQSFVKSVTIVEPPKQPGRKTYYSEYERRYITVPESTYIPTETKYQPQPDPSPQYYYDNNEPAESVEPQWRKELREFTEKTTQIQADQTNVKPPWEADSQYAKTPSSTYTPTPTWSQTLRPRSWRERSFESEYVGSQEWPKTSTLGRGRPLSSFNKNIDSIPERPRGVSVDRYNPNSYQSPSEHPPVQAHTLTTPAPHASYHNPNVPAYHSRASAEPRDHPTPYQQRVWSQARASPIQSRSFKYLQWITGTDD